ncbi:hypothetical protein MtrunA17_Chr8g0337141 [Medicago truncatula]|uniref:Uncharacterized protein n=1 Tax=Medicago truncatula TaxID=3880 RepID=A0A396GAP6_MEDTR|nr:hypothetical protein MtrunA17_Chr8g0337141 [Medicago truncatula]
MAYTNFQPIKNHQPIKIHVFTCLSKKIGIGNLDIPTIKYWKRC